MIGPTVWSEGMLRLYPCPIGPCGWLPERVRGWPPYVAATQRMLAAPRSASQQELSRDGISLAVCRPFFIASSGFNTQNCRRLDSVSEDQRR